MIDDRTDEKHTATDAGEDLIRSRISYLKEDTDFISTLFENLVGYGIIAADFDGNIIAYNKGAQQIYGYAPAEVIGKQSVEVFFPKASDGADHLQDIVKNVLGNERYAYSGEQVRNDGGRFPADILFTITKDRGGRVVGFIIIVDDLTEKKLAEERLKQARAELESSRQKIRRQEEMAKLDEFSGSAHTSVTAGVYGQSPLKESAPEVYEELLARLESTFDNILESRSYKVEYDRTRELRAIGEDLGSLKSTARDLVQVYTEALKKRSRDAPAAKAQLYMEEGRLVVLELMGYLAMYYRKYSFGQRNHSAGPIDNDHLNINKKR
jgi:PAS domain S-box-containing protein